MTSRWGIRLGCWLGTMSLVAAVSTAARAQGYGPDPFRPYNSQYDPYRYPMGPAAPGAGQGIPVLPRSGLFGANQFQEYLNGVTGSGRDGRTRGGIGTPYYRSAVDSAYEQALGRDYRPNREADRPFEQAQEEVTNKYIAYFSERDPKKRAAILRQYRPAPRGSSRGVGTGRESPSRLLESALESPYRPRSGAGRSRPTTRADRAGALPPPLLPSRGARTTPRSPASRLRSRAVDSLDDLGLPPSLPSLAPSRPGDRPRRAPTPSEVLNRARALGGRDDRTPGARSPSTGSRRTDRRSPPPPPPVNP